MSIFRQKTKDKFELLYDKFVKGWMTKEKLEEEFSKINWGDYMKKDSRKLISALFDKSSNSILGPKCFSLGWDFSDIEDFFLKQDFWEEFLNSIPNSSKIYFTNICTFYFLGAQKNISCSGKGLFSKQDALYLFYPKYGSKADRQRVAERYLDNCLEEVTLISQAKLIILIYIFQINLRERIEERFSNGLKDSEKGLFSQAFSNRSYGVYLQILNDQDKILKVFYHKKEQLESVSDLCELAFFNLKFQNNKEMKDIIKMIMRQIWVDSTQE